MSEQPRVAQAQIEVVGTLEGHPADPVVRFPLAHGELPEAGLRGRGWEPVSARAIEGRADPHELRIVYDVRPAGDGPQAVTDPHRDADLVVAPGEVAVPYQRVAAYGIVTSSRGVLLSRFAGSTDAEGQWGLVGGGVDPGELPQEALHREVWEESGQVVEVTGLAAVTSGHWVGRAPDGRLEDFHAVRIAYWGHCPHPTDPVVHDVGGTTAESAWVPLADLGRVPLVTSWATALPRLLAARG